MLSLSMMLTLLGVDCLDDALFVYDHQHWHGFDAVALEGFAVPAAPPPLRDSPEAERQTEFTDIPLQIFSSKRGVKDDNDLNFFRVILPVTP